MNSIKVDLLTTKERDRISSDIQDLADDAQIRTKIILRKRGAQTFVPTTGIVSYIWTSTETYALKGIYSVKETSSGVGSGVLGLGDFYFIVPEKNIGAVLPLDKDDRILGLIYSTGAVTITKGSKSVAGDGTEWTSYIGKGDYFKLSIEPLSYLQEIATVPTNTTLTLISNYTGSTKINQQCEIFREYMIISTEEHPFNGLLRRYNCREIK